jgi:hypothetical protein
VDYDADGIDDVITGSIYEDIYIFRGLGDGLFAKAKLLKDKDGKPLEGGYCCTTELLDMDADGDLDLVCATRIGKVTWRKNVGTRSSPKFDAKARPLPMEKSAAPMEGFNATYADWDGDGRRDLVVGSGRGHVVWHRNVGADDKPKFSSGRKLLNDSGFPEIKEGDVPAAHGSRAKVHIVDYDNDGLLDIMLGDFTSCTYNTRPPLTDEEIKEKEALEKRAKETGNKAYYAEVNRLNKLYWAAKKAEDFEEVKKIKAMQAEQRRPLDELYKKLRPFRTTGSKSHGWVWFYRQLPKNETAAQAEEIAGPNLLFICADQWRGQALGFLEQEPVLTPNLDRLATESLVLTQAVSNYPVCSPYRAMLMTGMYPHANGVLGNCNSTGTKYGCELKEKARCWSDILDDRGYSLGYVGKWHLEAPREPYVESYNNSEKSAWNEWTPPARRHGFQFWYAYNTFDRHLTPEYWATDSRRDQRVRVEQWSPEHEAEMAIRFIRNEDGKHREADKPFGLVVSMNPPHMPYRQVPAKYVDQYKDKSVQELLGSRPNLLPQDDRWGKYTRQNIKYQYAMMTGVDEQIGRILKTLDEIGARENTIVVFTSDHGDCLGLHGMVSKNNHFEESMRIP